MFSFEPERKPIRHRTVTRTKTRKSTQQNQDAENVGMKQTTANEPLREYRQLDIEEPTYTFIPGAVVSTYLMLYKRLLQLGHGIEPLTNAFKMVNPYFLVSFGDLYPLGIVRKLQKKNNSNSNNNIDIGLLVDKCIKDFESFEPLIKTGGKLFIDSGGFQISTGRIEEGLLPEFIETYHRFIPQVINRVNHNEDPNLYKGTITNYFFLDAIPGSNGIFKSPDIVTYWCLESLKNLKSHGLHKDPKTWDLFTFIVHVGTQARYEMWNKFMEFITNELQTLPKKYSVGGLVAGGGRYKYSHVLHWIYGFIYILYWLYIKSNQPIKGTRISFHVLGLVELVYVLSLFIIGEYVHRKFGLVVDFTYDGTAFLKKSLMGRLCGYIEPGTLRYSNICYTSKNLKTVVGTHNGKTVNVEEYIMNEFWEFWKTIGYDTINTELPTMLYTEDNKGPFHKDVSLWLPFIENKFQNMIKYTYMEQVRKVVDDIIKQNTWDSTYELIGSVFEVQSIENKKTMFKQIKNSILLIDKLFEEGMNFNFYDNMYLPSLTVTEVY